MTALQGVASLLAVFVAQPAFALVPAAALVLMFLRRRRPIVLAAAVAWLAYLPYELAMKHRILCSGECDIRVDLLLLYPALALLTLAAAIAHVRAAGQAQRGHGRR